MADQIKEALGVDVALVSGAKGEFTIRVDGEAVASKSPAGFPAPEECVARVRAALGQA